MYKIKKYAYFIFYMRLFFMHFLCLVWFGSVCVGFIPFFITHSKLCVYNAEKKSGRLFSQLACNDALYCNPSIRPFNRLVLPQQRRSKMRFLLDFFFACNFCSSCLTSSFTICFHLCKKFNP